MMRSIAVWSGYAALWLVAIAPFFILFPRRWRIGDVSVDATDALMLSLIAVTVLIATVTARATQWRKPLSRAAAIGAVSGVLAALVIRLAGDKIETPRLIHGAMGLDGEEAINGSLWEAHCLVFFPTLILLTLLYWFFAGSRSS